VTERKRGEESQRFLARASAVLDAALDVEVTAASLARLCIPVLGDICVLDMGAGGGELLAALAAGAPDRWSLVGVDVAPRPTGLPVQVRWLSEPPARVTGLVVANEWLDVVPVDVVELTDDGPRLLQVADDGEERPDGAPTAEDLDWLGRWWPLAEVGDRAEVGRPRDEAWAALVGRLTRGVALAVDYAADPERDVAGTLTAFHDGRQVLPVPDGSCDLTAHVRLESCAATVRDVETRMLSQREALRGLGLTGARPAYDGDPQAYVAALSRATEAAELTAADGLGAFTWLVQARECTLPV